MRRRPRQGVEQAIPPGHSFGSIEGDLGLVLSGGGARAAYQVGCLRALAPYLDRTPSPIEVVVGSSIGAINGLILSALLRHGYSSAVEQLDAMWRKRTFRNTFRGSPSGSFLRAIRVAVLQYLSPGPRASDQSIFDPTPLMEEVDAVIRHGGGLSPEHRAPTLGSVGVMTTIEGSDRKPLLFLSTHKQLDDAMLEGASFEICYVNELTAKHGFASAALPSVLPPVELDTDRGKVRLVDGGISQNIPADPAARLGAHRVIIVDISGRDWWLERSGESKDTRPSWEVAAKEKTFCFRPPDTLVLKPRQSLGQVLKATVASSPRKFMAAVGPTWPIFELLRRKLGEEVAYETMSYCALDQDYLGAIMELGYHETMTRLRSKRDIPFVPATTATAEPETAAS